MNEQKGKQAEIDFPQGMPGKANPYGIMGAFVYNYETVIKPGIQDGNLAVAAGVILDACERAEGVERQMDRLKKGSYAPYRMALAQLRGLADPGLRGKLSEGGLGKVLASVGAQVAELDFIMHGNEVYEKHRQRKIGAKQ